MLHLILIVTVDVCVCVCVCRCGRDYCDAKEIMTIADAMASNGMKELGYEYINFDGN